MWPLRQDCQRPHFVWPNDGDFGYGLFLPDARSAQWLLAHTHELNDELLRAQSWGALWDLLREAELAPAQYVRRVLEALPHETDEALSGTLLGRALTAMERYMTPAEAAPLVRQAEHLLLARADDADVPYGLRKAAFDAYLGLASTEQGRTVLRQYLSGQRRFDDKPISQVSRWSALRRLVALGARDAQPLLQAEVQRDSTPERDRSAFVAGAALPDAALKQRYFDRYFNDVRLNEEWVTASLSAFNDPLHASLSRQHLRTALEKSEWIRQNRRIFFLPRWLEAFIEGQSTRPALEIVDQFLATSNDLPLDLRRKILQSRDELERTVRIRERSSN